MHLLSVRTLDLESWLGEPSGKVDLAIFACGYEARSAALAQSLDFSRISKSVVFSFSEYPDVPSRTSAATFYDGRADIQKVSLKGADDVGVYEILRQLISTYSIDQPLKIVIDYSSMSRVWYGAILNFFRHSSRRARVDLHMIYLAGVYEGQVRSNHVEAITSVPGFEGIAAGTGKSCAFFSLGFDPWCAFAVHERIEPDEAWAILANRSDVPEYFERAKRLNADFIKNYARDRLLSHSPFDLEGVFAKLCELISRELAHSPDITLVGLGPKPHILSMMLTAIRFPEATLVQARGRRIEPKNVTTDGRGVCAVVEFIPDMAAAE